MDYVAWLAAELRWALEDEVDSQWFPEDWVQLAERIRIRMEKAGYRLIPGVVERPGSMAGVYEQD